MLTIPRFLSRDFQKARSVNATNTTFASKVVTLTEPSGDAGTATGASVIDLCVGGNGVSAANEIVILPYGTGDADDVFDMRVIGWRCVGRSATPTWIPVTLAGFTCTLSAATGVAGGALVVAELLCDTIALTGTSGNDDISIDIVSPANDTAAHVTVKLKGFQKIELIFDMTTNNPTGANCLIALV